MMSAFCSVNHQRRKNEKGASRELLSADEIVNMHHKRKHLLMCYLGLRDFPLFFALSLLEHRLTLFGPLNVPAHSQHALQ